MRKKNAIASIETRHATAQACLGRRRSARSEAFETTPSAKSEEWKTEASQCLSGITIIVVVVIVDADDDGVKFIQRQRKEKTN